MNNIKTKVDDLDDEKLKTLPTDLKEVASNTIFNNLNMKLIVLENEILDVSTLIQSKQYNTDKVWWKN